MNDKYFFQFIAETFCQGMFIRHVGLTHHLFKWMKIETFIRNIKNFTSPQLLKLNYLKPQPDCLSVVPINCLKSPLDTCAGKNMRLQSFPPSYQASPPPKPGTSKMCSSNDALQYGKSVEEGGARKGLYDSYPPSYFVPMNDTNRRKQTEEVIHTTPFTYTGSLNV